MRTCQTALLVASAAAWRPSDVAYTSKGPLSHSRRCKCPVLCTPSEESFDWDADCARIQGVTNPTPIALSMPPQLSNVSLLCFLRLLAGRKLQQQRDINARVLEIKQAQDARRDSAQKRYSDYFRPLEKIGRRQGVLSVSAEPYVAQRGPSGKRERAPGAWLAAIRVGALLLPLGGCLAALSLLQDQGQT